ncbi:PQQ-binding-like beta-propeller repeat protein [Nonomuraea sp. NPDC003560]|uniref:outer membrane protein assembly factor BamB family protein n=1 Tax=Nonomuraea sp. NPDC003560 TaxID=3364341 RepID=UPI0036C64622
MVAAGPSPPDRPPPAPRGTQASGSAARASRRRGCGTTRTGTPWGVSDELLTVRSKTAVTAYRIADGALTWRRDLDAARDGTVLTDGVHTYVAEDTTTLVKLDARTGRVVDRRRFDDDVTPRSMRDGLAAIGVGAGDDVLVG